MSKFGELVNSEIPRVILFHSLWSEISQAHIPHVHKMQADFEEKVKVTLIDIDKNQELCDALRIGAMPTYMIYHKGEMLFRKSGDVSVEELIKELGL